MKDEDKTKEQLINELAGLRQRVGELEILESKHKQAEETLRESDKKYRSLFENMLNAFAYCKILVDENNQPIDYVHLEVNDAWERSIGLKREDVIGKKITEVIPGIKESKTDLISIYGEVALTGEATEFELYFEPLGKWFTISVYSPQKGYFVAIFDDITERKQAEKELRESEERYRALVNLGGKVGEAIVMLQDNEQGDAVHTFVNDEWPHMTGYSRKELLGMSFFDLVHPKHYEASLKRHQRKMSGEAIPGLFEMSIIRKDGTEVPVEITSAYTTYRGKRANVAFIRDITERKRTVEILRESEEKYKELAESISDVFFAFNEELRYTYWNKASEELTGISAKDALGKHLYDLFLDTEMTRRAEEVYLKVLRTKQPQHFINEYQLGGKDFVFEISAYPSKNGLSVFTKDVTERKQAEDKEKELQQELLMSSRLASIGELAAGVAHEINNPLTGIMGFSERLLRKSTDEEVSRDLERIHSEASRAAKVVENLRTFARRREPEKEYSDINDILQKTLELRTYELKTSNIEVDLELSPTLPKTVVDFQQIQDVFLNIILNAEQVMTEANGGGKLVIKTQKVKDYVRISFADDGPGIPAEHLDRIFDPFFTTRSEKDGTGLGLSVCHGIVEKHGGRIYARNKPGKGATFFVELPVTTGEIDESKIVEE